MTMAGTPGRLISPGMLPLGIPGIILTIPPSTGA